MAIKNTIISAIVATSENHVIGKNNQLPWRMPADLKHFKAITTGNPILMGRKTYESIGRPLPNRTNIIITRNPDYHANDCIVVASIEQALEYANKENIEEIFIIGGAEVYQQLLPITNRIYLTIIHHHFDGDAYFPALNAEDWKESKREDFLKDDDNHYDYSFLVLERIRAC